MEILTKRFNLIRIILLILATSSTLTLFIGDVASTRPPSSGAGGVLATILVGDRPDGIAYNPSNQMVYITVLGSAYNSPRESRSHRWEEQQSRHQLAGLQ